MIYFTEIINKIRFTCVASVLSITSITTHQQVVHVCSCLTRGPLLPMRLRDSTNDALVVTKLGCNVKGYPAVRGVNVPVTV